MSTTYNILVRGTLGKIKTDERGLLLSVRLPTESEDTEFIHVDREDGTPLLGIELAHGEVVAGHWPIDMEATDEWECSATPGGEEWVSAVRVTNDIGHGPANEEATRAAEH